MRTIIARFSDIMSANMNALLDRVEDPEKMVEQTIRNLERDLVQVKVETAGIMADAENSKKRCEDNKKEIENLAGYVQKAIKTGSEEDAKQFIKKKQQLEQVQAYYDQQYSIAKENADKVHEMHDKLCADLACAKDRANLVRSKSAMAKAQEHINQVSKNANSADSLNTMRKWEEKADNRYEKAKAMRELDLHAGPVDALKSKYGNIDDESVAAELESLKRQMDIVTV